MSFAERQGYVLRNFVVIPLGIDEEYEAVVRLNGVVSLNPVTGMQLVFY